MKRVNYMRYQILKAIYKKVTVVSVSDIEALVQKYQKKNIQESTVETT